MAQTEKTLEIWTDGACKCNPGIGGWGAYMVWGQHTHEMYGGNKLTTNNQMGTDCRHFRLVRS